MFLVPCPSPPCLALSNAQSLCLTLTESCEGIVPLCLCHGGDAACSCNFPLERRYLAHTRRQRDGQASLLLSGNRRKILRGKSASERVSERTSERDGFRGFQRFFEVLRGFQRSSKVFRGFSKALSEPLSECHFPLRVAGRVAPNRVAP